MPYTPLTWVNDGNPPLSAANLNHLTDELEALAANYSITHTLPNWVNGSLPAITDAAPLNEMERVVDLAAQAAGLAYTPTTWQAGWTPARNATNLNKLEQAAAAIQAVIDTPPPPPGTDVVNGIEDFYFGNTPDNHHPLRYTIGGDRGYPPGGFFQYATPYGSGFQFIVTDAMYSIWDQANGTLTKCCLVVPDQARFYGQIGKRDQVSFYMYFPSGQQIPVYKTWQGGELFQWHTNTQSGHHLCLNWDGKFRIGRLSSVSSYVFTYTPMTVYTMFDRWIPVVWDIKWSQGADGFVRLWLDGTQYLNFSGASTFVGDGDLKMQFGFYSARSDGFTNEVRFSPITLNRT